MKQMKKQKWPAKAFLRIENDGDEFYHVVEQSLEDAAMIDQECDVGIYELTQVRRVIGTTTIKKSRKIK